MPIKEILLSIGSSIVKDRLGWRLLRLGGAKHSERGIVNISLVGCKHQTIAGKICDQSKKCQGKFDCLVYEMLFIK